MRCLLAYKNITKYIASIKQINKTSERQKKDGKSIHIESLSFNIVYEKRCFFLLYQSTE